MNIMLLLWAGSNVACHFLFYDQPFDVYMVLALLPVDMLVRTH